MCLKRLRFISRHSVIAAGLVFWRSSLTAEEPQLHNLPEYRPGTKVHGVIRNFGSPLSGLVKMWEEGFCAFQPDITFKDDLSSSDAAIGGLETGVADLAPNGREPALTEFLSFFETFKHDGPFQIAIATGSYDVPGRTWAEIIFVNKDNPLSRLTMKQLDGIFGEARTGGWDGYRWIAAPARSANDNIRTWGQLGLTGEWSDKPINTYGYAPTGMSSFFELKVFHGGTKWNPNYRQYSESNTKETAEPSLGSHQMLLDLSKDKYGIAWSGVAQAKGIAAIKNVALAAGDGKSYVEPTRETVQNRTYPLTRSVFMQLDRAPGKQLDAKLQEFLLYILSRQGQEKVVHQGEYLPLTDEVVRAERARLQ
jgi:phosphate transport system substrate-binding protein